jgi:hypothetical protein
MSRSILLTLLGSMLFAFSALADTAALENFNKRFTLVKNAEGKVVAIKLKKAVSTFSIMPFIEQIKSDLSREQMTFAALSAQDKEDEVNQMLLDLGVDPYSKDAQTSTDARHLRDSILNIKNIDLNDSFAQLDVKDFWKEFEVKLHEAMMFIDPTILTNMEDARFFYKRQVTYAVVEWALKEAQKRFANVPVLNIASFVIVRVHDMMLEQRHFHHNMLLHYFENVSETELGMTKEEVNKAVSSIYEYQISIANLPESNRAASNWMSYGMNNFYQIVRLGNSKIRNWADPLSTLRFSNISKIDYAFAEVIQTDAKTGAQSKMIYHTQVNAHEFTQKPALAFDYSNPNRIKRFRSLLNLGGVALGFLKLPNFIKSNVDTFIKSLYVEQVRMEGALVGYFDLHGNQDMSKKVFSQRNNFYIVE